VARHAIPHLVEATLIPLAVFYAALWSIGVWGALAAAVAWSYAAMIRRAITSRRIPGVLAIGVVLLTVRTIVTAASGSVFVYFLQPTLGTIAVAGAFLLSVPAGRPLAERLASDFLPISPDVLARPYIRRFFVRISLLWAFVHLGNAAVTIWLLVSQPIATYVVAKTFVSLAATGGAIAVSTLWFVHSMRGHGVRVRFAPVPVTSVNR
jgi:intracellular septation protein A